MSTQQKITFADVVQPLIISVQWESHTFFLILAINSNSKRTERNHVARAKSNYEWYDNYKLPAMSPVEVVTRTRSSGATPFCLFERGTGPSSSSRVRDSDTSSRSFPKATNFAARSPGRPVGKDTVLWRAYMGWGQS
jgi:hypothetical protein